MTTYYTNADTVQSGTLYQLLAGERLTVGPDAALAVTDSTAVLFLQDVSIVIAGDIYALADDGLAGGVNGGGDITVAQGGSVMAAGNAIQAIAALVVTNDGEIHGDEGGIQVTAALSLINDGVISGRLFGVSVGLQSHVVNNGSILAAGDDSFGGTALSINGGLAQVVNTGVIAAVHGAAVDAGSASFEVDFLNQGTVAGATHAYHGGTGADLVTNAGAMTGTVDLYAGDDLYDGRLGSVAGLVDGHVGDDTLLGGEGAERLRGGWDQDEIEGGGGNDVIEGGRGADLMEGGDGTDTLSYAGATDAVRVNLATGDAAGGDAEGDVFAAFERLTGGAGNDSLTGDGGDNVIRGGDGRDWVEGGPGNDRLYGQEGNDTLSGGAGDDRLVGDLGSDLLIGRAGRDVMEGGAGADLFRFLSPGDSGVATPDLVLDFAQRQGDRIDLGAMNAVAGGGDQAFTFIGAAAFGGVAGELRAAVADGGTRIEGDVNGDGAADFAILLPAAVTLAAEDFVL